MVEFCDNCRSILMPSKHEGKRVLVCNLCNKIVPLDDDLKNSYIFSEEIEHPDGEEFKNLIKMKNWRK